MDNSKKLIDQCKKIYENSLYSAETHHVIASNLAYWSKVIQIVPAVASALLVSLVSLGYIPLWLGWIGVVGSVISAVGGVLDPNKGYYDHLGAAKSFTAIKRDADFAVNVNGSMLKEKELLLYVQCLLARYNDLVKTVPPTDNKSFEVARARIKAGFHNSDLVEDLAIKQKKQK